MDIPIDQVKSHYEYVIESKDSVEHSVVKEKALCIMDSLEGWCSREKASILMDLIFEFKPKKIVEIGVFGGKSLIPMAFVLKENGFGKIYGIDPWTSEASIDGWVGEGWSDQVRKYWGCLDHEKVLKSLIIKIRDMNLTDQIELVRKKSEEALPINDIDLLHIDGNHSEKCSYFDVNKWVPLVSEGGIIIFDDINWEETQRAVNYLNENCTKLNIFSDETDWGIWLKQ